MTDKRIDFTLLNRDKKRGELSDRSLKKAVDYCDSHPKTMLDFWFNIRHK